MPLRKPGRAALAVLVLAAAVLPAAQPARAVEEEIRFKMTNGRSEAVRGMIANQGAQVWLKPGQTEVIESYFAAVDESEAKHVVRFEPLHSAFPRYCEWVATIHYKKENALSHRWSCSAYLNSHDGATCRESYNVLGNDKGGCSFIFFIQ